MERLTIDEAIEHCNEKTDCSECGQQHAQLAEWLEELKQYRDAEEQGLLLRLPCKVGDVLWWTDAFGDLCSSEVNSMFIEQGIDGIVIETWICNINGKEIGKTAFLTQEEAEQALARMEKKHE